MKKQTIIAIVIAVIVVLAITIGVVVGNSKKTKGESRSIQYWYGSWLVCIGVHKCF